MGNSVKNHTCAKRFGMRNNMNYDTKRLETGLAGFGLEFTKEQLEQLLSYYELLIEKNKVMNLTAITEFDEVVEKHFLDSLSVCRFFDLKKESEKPGGLKVLDLGTGAGFPGIPLKIAFPNIDMVLADSLNKRILFLRDVIDKLGLKKISAVHARAEELARDKACRENFDLCISRAVANLSTLSEYCLPFVKKGGCFISYKSGEIEEEAAAAERAAALLGGAVKDIHKFVLPGTDLHRSFVVIEKVKPTPKVYPRKAGTPSREPL